MIFEFIVGARPNFMKVAPIMRDLRRRAPHVAPRLVHTGQHYDPALSDVFLSQLGIGRPDVSLEVGSCPQGEQVGRILTAHEQHLMTQPRPAGVVVVGDVNSTMACTLSSVKLGIPVAHVEAGLRSFDRTMPEEINRIVTDSIADLLLVSEPTGLSNLAREGVLADRIRYVGNVMIDTLVYERAAAEATGALEALGVAGSYAYVTLHRPSNVDERGRLGALVQLLLDVARELPVVFAVHPRTRAKLREFELERALSSAANLQLVEPQGYRESLCLMGGATVVLTDSGGIQEETTFLGVPCLTLRPNTERPATVEFGTSTLVGDALDRVPGLVREALGGRYKRPSTIEGWDGRAAERVVDTLLAAWQ